jgi:hypothetical protein
LLATGRYIGVLPNSMLQSMAEKVSLKVLPVGLPMTGRQVDRRLEETHAQPDCEALHRNVMQCCAEAYES